MDPGIIGQIVVNGLMLGGIYALVAVGLSLIFGVVGFVNFAHGSFLMIGMYLSWGLWKLAGIDPFLSLILIIPAFLALGWIFYNRLVDPIIEMPDQVHLFMTLGIALMLDNGFLLAFTADYKSLQTFYSDIAIYIGSIVFALPRLISLSVAMLSGMILVLFLTRTRTGRAIQAVSQDRDLAESMGVDSKQIFALSVGIGLVLAGIAGVLLTMFHPTYPTVGLKFLLVGFITVVVGGMGSIKGSIIAALIVGLLYSIGYQLFGGEGGLIFSYIMLLGVLNLKPTGLYGKELF